MKFNIFLLKLFLLLLIANAGIEPLNVTDETCIASSPSFGIWKIQNCKEKKPFICEISKSKEKSKRGFFTTLWNSINGATIFQMFYSCPLGWFHLTETNACFGLSYTQQNSSIFKSWKDAEEHCIKFGGHLPSFRNLKEFHVLQVLHISTMQPIWIGLKSDKDKGWKWSDNSSLDYLPWQKGYPKLLEEESCGIAELSTITNKDCNELAWVICKKSAVLSVSK